MYYLTSGHEDTREEALLLLIYIYNIIYIICIYIHIAAIPIRDI